MTLHERLEFVTAGQPTHPAIALIVNHVATLERRLEALEAASNHQSVEGPPTPPDNITILERPKKPEPPANIRIREGQTILPRTSEVKQ